MIGLFFNFLFGVVWGAKSGLLDGSQITLAPAFRSYPFGGGLETSARLEKLLWDDRSHAFYNYGFVQGRLLAASYGMVEAGVSVFPVSFIELYGGKGMTYRYYGSSFVNCEDYECRGRADRERVGIRLLGGAGDFFMVANFGRVWTRMASAAANKKPILEELESVELQPGGEPMESSLVFVAFTREKNLFGVVARYARTLQESRNAQGQYLVARVLEGPTSYMLGVGRFESSVVPSGPSLFLIVTYSLGQSLSFF